jgi:hypothetical protein
MNKTIRFKKKKGSSGGGGKGLVANETNPHQEVLNH